MRTEHYPPVQLSPRDYEKAVKAYLDAMGEQLLEYRSEHREKPDGPGGEYEIDVTVRFTALGVDFLVLVECKHYRRKVEREVFQVLHDKIRLLGAHKGMVFTTSGFQSGALEYAEVHGVAAIWMKDGRTEVIRKADGLPELPPRPPVGWLLGSGGRESLISAEYGANLRRFLGLPDRPDDL